MKRWRRATIADECGFCGRAIAVGEPELLFVFAGVQRPKRRCPTCAGEPVPADLPALEPVDVGVIGGGERSTRSQRAPADWKARASGDGA